MFTAPVEVRYVPEGHKVQTDPLCPSKYVPAEHTEQALAPDVEYSPLLHAVHEGCAAASEYEPAVQGVHCTAPVLKANVPGEQSMHELKFRPLQVEYLPLSQF